MNDKVQHFFDSQIEEIDIENMSQVPQRDFSINHITDCVISEIIVLSEAGTDFRKVSVEVAKEILNRFEKEVKEVKNVHSQIFTK